MIRFKIGNLTHSVTGEAIVLPEITTAQRDGLENLVSGALVNHEGVLEQWKGGEWKTFTDGYVTVQDFNSIPVINDDQFTTDTGGRIIIKKQILSRAGQINFITPGVFGSISDPLLDVDDINLTIGEDENEIVLYITMDSVPQFVTDLGLAGSFSTAATDVNRVILTKLSSDTIDGVLKVFARGDELGDFIFLQFEDVVDDPVPATLTDSGSPSLTIDLDAADGITYNLGPVKQAIGLNSGSFLLLDRLNAPVATFLDSFTQGFGISFWAKVPTTASTGGRTIFSTNGDFDGTGVRVSTTSGGQVQFYVKAVTSAASSQRIITGGSDVITNNGEWHHWVVSWRQFDGQARIWKNSVLTQGQGTITADTAVSLNNGFINKSATFFTYETWYDDMRIRPTYFTQIEVDDLFSQGNPVFANQTNLLATSHFYLRFEDSIDPLPDYFIDSGSEFIRADYIHEGGGTTIETDGTEQAIGIGLPASSGGSRLSLNITKTKVSNFLNSMSEAFTIAFRVKVKPDSTVTTRMFFSNDNNFDGAAGIRINCLGSNGQVQFYVGASSADPTLHRVVTTMSNVIINDDTYSNWVFTYNRSTSTATIYKDGTQAAQRTDITVDNTTNFVVGTVNPLIGHGPTGSRFQTVFSRFIIAPKVLDATERSQIFS